MSIQYKTIMQESQSSLIIEKSKFFGFACPVQTQEEADAFVGKIKKLHKDATHNVPVYVLGEKFDVQRYSDDGEPSGTAGVPVLQMLIKEGITNVAIVVTRYFGGIKLGTGGLVRAYTNAAKEALKLAVIAEVKNMDVIEVKVDYSSHGKFENMALDGEYSIENTEYGEAVIMKIMMDPSLSAKVKQDFMEVTAGKCIFLKEETVLEKVPIA